MLCNTVSMGTFTIDGGGGVHLEGVYKEEKR